MFLFDVLHLFRGYSRSVLILDWALSTGVLLGVHYLPRMFNGQTPKSDHEDLSWRINWKNWFQRALTYFLPLFMGLGAYMLINKSYAGTALPISGTIKRWWGLLPNTVYGTPIKTLTGVVQGLFSPSPNSGPWSLLLQPLDSLAQSMSRLFAPFLNADPKQVILILVMVILAGVIIWLVRRQSAWAVKTADRFGLLPLFAGCLFSIISYKATGYLHAKYWYWIPEMVFLVMSGGILLECIFSEIRQRVKTKDMTRKISTVLCLLIFIIFTFNVWQILRWNVGLRSQHPYITETEIIENNTQPGSVIGMTGGGVTAYFIHDRTVVNLDGLINGNAYYQQLKVGNADQYFASINLKYVVGAPSMLLDSDPYRWILEDHLIPIRPLGEVTLYSYHPPVS
jgi:hypothetical protein